MTTQEIVNAAAALDTEQLRDVMHTLTLELASRRHTPTSHGGREEGVMPDGQTTMPG